MPVHPDPLLSVALQLVWDEREALASDVDTAAHIRRHAVGHARAVLALAEEGGRATARATALGDGTVVIAVAIHPKCQP